MILLSDDDGVCSIRPYVRSAGRSLLSARPSSVAAPAIPKLSAVTTASKTMLQFSSRILMPVKTRRGSGGSSPGNLRRKLEKSWASFEVQRPIGGIEPAEPASGLAFDNEAYDRLQSRLLMAVAAGSLRFRWQRPSA